jgi:nitrogenase molybdenum-cofactor synthesis protein NifE
MAMLALGKKIIEPARTIREKTVNLLGATIFEFPDADSLKDLLDYVAGQGLEVLSVWGICSPLEILCRAASAQLNLVVSVSGLPLAKWMQEVWGIPYVIFAPLGESAPKDIIRTDTKSKNNAAGLSTAERPRVLIVGEQIMASGLRDYIEQELQINAVQVAGFFMMEKDILKRVDKQLHSEADLEALLEENKYDILIGDPLLQRFMPEESPIEFWSWPQLAISGQFFLNERNSLLGEKGREWLKGQMGKVKKQ